MTHKSEDYKISAVKYYLKNKETEAFNKSEKGIMDVYCFSNNIYCNVSGDIHFPFLY